MWNVYKFWPISHIMNIVKNDVLNMSVSQWLMSRWNYQFLCNHWSQASWAQPVFRWAKHVEQSGCKANMVAQGDGKLGHWGWPQDPSKPKTHNMLFVGGILGSISSFSEKQCLFYTLIARQQHLHLRNVLSNWEMVELLKMIVQELVFPSWH